MPENKPIPDAELAEVKHKVAAAPSHTWIVGRNKASGRVGVHNGKHQVCAVWHTTANPAMDTAQAIAALHNAFGPILARLEAAERERDDLEAEVEELRDNSIEYEKDCTKALCGLAREFNYEWDGDGATADDLREFISEIVVDAKQRLEAAEREQQRVHELANRLLDANNGLIDTIRKLDPEALCDWHDSIGGDEYLQRWLAARDAQQRRDGAAEVWDQISKITAHVTDGFIRVSKGYAEEQAESLREGGE